MEKKEQKVRWYGSEDSGWVAMGEETSGVQKRDESAETRRVDLSQFGVLCDIYTGFAPFLVNKEIPFLF